MCLKNSQNEKVLLPLVQPVTSSPRTADRIASIVTLGKPEMKQELYKTAADMIRRTGKKRGRFLRPPDKIFSQRIANTLFRKFCYIPLVNQYIFNNQKGKT